jgi:hypothetical protein
LVPTAPRLCDQPLCERPQRRLGRKLDAECGLVEIISDLRAGDEILGRPHLATVPKNRQQNQEPINEA